MKKIFILLLLTSTISVAQYKIKGELSTSKKYTWVILYRIVGGKQIFVKNSTIKASSKTINSNKNSVGKFEFELPADAKSGSYRVSYKNGFVDLLFNKEDIYFSFNPKKVEETITFSKSENNKTYRKYIKEVSIVQRKIKSLQIEYFKNTSKEIADLYVVQVKKISDLQETYVKKAKGKLVKFFIEAYNKYNKPTIAKTPQEYMNLVVNHYFDYIDFNNTALYNSSFLTDKINYYVFYINYSKDAKTQEKLNIKSVKTILNKIKSVTFKRDIIEFLITQFIHQGNADFTDYLLVTYYDNFPKKLQNTDFRKKTLEKMAVGIGRTAPEIVWKENGKEYKLSTISEAQNYVLIFWSTECSHCLKEIPKLNAFTQDKNNTKVIAFGMEKDKKTWSNHIQKLKGWHHILGLNKWENTISKTYQIYSTPSYIVLDSDKKIIAKPESLENLKTIISALE